MSEPIDPHEVRDQLRRLIDAAPPVTADEARSVASSDPSVGALAAIEADVGTSDLRRRAPLLVAAAAVLVLLVGGAALVWPDRAEHTGVITRPPTTDLGPAPTVLAPVGDDPLVSCDPARAQWYRVSAWSNPVGAENAGDPASTALRNYLSLKSAAETANGGGPLLPGLPTNNWRRLSETDTEVLFGAGELDLDQIASENIGPMLSIETVELTDGTWRSTGGGGGSCNDLWVHPGESNSVARWWIADDDLPLPPETTELHVRVPSWSTPCGPSVTAEDVLGPNVIETDTTVTVRVAYSAPQIDMDDHDACDEDTRDHLGDPPITVNAHLRAPLGKRVILDGNRHPAVAIRTEPEPEREKPPPPPRIELPGGTHEVQVMGNTSPDPACDDSAGPCGIPAQPLHLTVTAGADTARGSTDSMGSAIIVVPDGLVQVSAEADGRWCPTQHSKGDAFHGSLSIACTRLDQPHATVSGNLVSSGKGDGWSIGFTGPPMQNMTVAVRPDGSFEAELAAGRWQIAVINTDGTQTCSAGPVNSIDVVDGVGLILALTCA